MMGQQQIVAEKAGGALRRIVLALTVAVLMAAMMVVMAAPAFAGNAKGQNNTNHGYTENDVNKSADVGGFLRGSDVFFTHGNGDWRN